MLSFVDYFPRGQHGCISVKNLVGRRSSNARVVPHGALWFDRAGGKCVAGFRDKKARDYHYTETF